MNPGLVDAHAHLSDIALWDERVEILQRAGEAGVGLVLNVGYDRLTSERAIELGRESMQAAPAVGIHPNNIPGSSSEDFDAVETWAALPEVVALGETGLDFYWNTTPEGRQREVFQWHLELGRRHGLPLTIHSRNAESAALDEIAALPPPGGVLHCFGGDQETARRALDLGLYLGVDGPITFKKSSNLHDLVRWMPLDRLLIETDAPYLTPHPFRGKRNEPARVALVAEKVAELKGISAEDVAHQSTENAFALFPRLRVRWDKLALNVNR